MYIILNYMQRNLHFDKTIEIKLFLLLRFFHFVNLQEMCEVKYSATNIFRFGYCTLFSLKQVFGKTTHMCHDRIHFLLLGVSDYKSLLNKRLLFDRGSGFNV